MKTSKRKMALILAVVMALALSACGQTAPAQTASPSDAAIAITDMTGREVKLDKPAEKIVVLTPSDCEILYALGAGGTVIGRGEYCDYPSDVLSVPSVKSGSDMNIEQVISLSPDVVLMSIMDVTKEQVASLEAAGMKVVLSNAQDIDGVYEAIRMIGKLVGKSGEAEKVIGDMEGTFSDIKSKATYKGDKTIYFEVSPLQYGLYAAGSGTFMDEIAQMLGLKNIFSDMEGWPQVSEEQVIQRNPDFIVTTTMSFEGSPDPVEEVMGRKGWENITAIKNGKVYNADSNAATRPGPRLVEAARELFNFVYGASDSAPAAS